jgi:hypothetical protein
LSNAKADSTFFNVSLDYLLDVTDEFTPVVVIKETEPKPVYEKTLKEAIQSADELSDESKKDMLRHLSLVTFRDKHGLAETVPEFYDRLANA